MLAEKCPNCGAFLPVRRPGVAVRTCEFCDLEVPGDAPVVDVPEVTPATWLPSPKPIGAQEALERREHLQRAAAAARRRTGRLAFAVVGLVVAGGIIAFVVKRGKTSSPPPAEAVVPATAEAVTPAPVRAEEAPARVALREAVQAAGGVAALDADAMLAFVQERVRATAEDAVLLMYQCPNVRSDGRADLTLTPDAYCGYDFRAPSRVRRPDDVPAGVPTSVTCELSFQVNGALDRAEVGEHSNRLEDCRRHHVARPPRCTMPEIWKRAIAAGAPADAVARVRYHARYQSPYDPVDPADDPDRAERGRWDLDIDRDDGPDFRLDTADDCGQPPPTADEQRVLDALEAARPALKRCFARSAGKEASVEAFEAIWRLAVDAAGKVTIAFADPGVDIEGFFQGDLGAIRTRFADCSEEVAQKLRLPRGLGEIRLGLRVERDGALVVAPPPFE